MRRARERQPRLRIPGAQVRASFDLVWDRELRQLGSQHNGARFANSGPLSREWEIVVPGPFAELRSNDAVT